MLELLFKGGVLMIPITVCSVAGLAIIIERLIRMGPGSPGAEQEIQQALDALEQGRVEEAIAAVKSGAGPVARVFAAGLGSYVRYRQEQYVEKTIVRTGSRELMLLERNLRGLNAIANAAPLLGLLGTVTGMIKAFMQIQAHGGAVDAAMLAGGIWEAMITTAAGLTVAIPCLFFYNYFMGRVNRVEAAMKNAAADLVETIQKREHHGVYQNKKRFR